MKKLISIGVALALLAIIVLPVSAAAAPPPGCPDIGNYTYPQTFAKIPFAIIQSGFALIGNILPILPTSLGIPVWLNAALMNTIGGWAGGPLSWTVDMMGWGLWMVADIIGPLASTLGLPVWVPGVLNGLVCGVFTPYTCVYGNNMSLNCT